MMKKGFSSILLVGLCCMVHAQTVTQKLDAAVKKLLADESMTHATMSLYVVNTQTGAVVYDYNGKVGLAPASTQKIMTSVAAFDLLTPAYRFKTTLAFEPTVDAATGNLYIVGYGDPSLGSFRYESTKEAVVKKRWLAAIQRKGITNITNLYGYDNNWESQSIPGGWIWDDIGNYYGAGVTALNWNENQYELQLKPGKKEGDPVSISGTYPLQEDLNLTCELTTGKPGSGDNAYIYIAPYSNKGYVRGTIPPGDKMFPISGAVTDPAGNTAKVFARTLAQNGITVSGYKGAYRQAGLGTANLPDAQYIDTFYSPALDSLNYWFLKKSINLYGEAFAKAIAFEQTGYGNADSGMAIIKRFWQQKGLNKGAVKMVDACGLSPQNRITTQALVTALQYAYKQPWFKAFEDGLPLYNGMKLKSGTIANAKGYAGYHTAANGTTYTIAIIVNNFDMASSSMVKRMFTILDELK